MKEATECRRFDNGLRKNQMNRLNPLAKKESVIGFSGQNR
jgi:hypothetical protein